MFDGVGNRLQMNYPGGKVISSYPDELHHISNIRSGAYSPTSTDPVVSAYKYIGVGRVKERSYLNGTNLAVQYDGVKRVTDYTNNTGANVISQYQYGYDNVFNKLFEKRLHHGKRDDYVYDSLYRLTEYRKDGDLNGSNPAKTIGYMLDGAGNRTQVTENGTPTTYNVNNLNQYTSVGGQAQMHDDNGNLTSDGTRMFSYDYANRLVRIVTATQTIIFKYDVFGRRIEKSVDGAITRYYYEGARVIEDRDGADAVSATYVFGNGIDEILTMDRGGQTYYYHTNVQGSITEITDSTGAIVERYEYDAYGAITIFTAPGVDGLWQTADDVVSAVSAIGNRYTFTGREYEPESGLYYYRARFYDPATGRFLQRDPIGNDMLGNLYAYVNNSPVVFVDPRGLRELDPVETAEFFSMINASEQIWDAIRGLQEEMRTASGEEKSELVGLVAELESEKANILKEAAEYHNLIQSLPEEVDSGIYLAQSGVSAGAGFVPVVGDIKGFGEVFTGTDIVTGEKLGAWRWAGLFPVLGTRWKASAQAGKIAKIVEKVIKIASVFKRAKGLVKSGVALAGRAFEMLKSIRLVRAAVTATKGGRAFEDILKSDPKTFKKFLESLQGVVARGGGARTVEETRKLLGKAKDLKYEIRKLETKWISGPHINIRPPGGGPDIHLPVPSDFVP